MFEVWTCHVQPKVNKYIQNCHLRLFYIRYCIIYSELNCYLKLEFSFCIQLGVETNAPVFSNDTTHSSQRSLYTQVFIAMYIVISLTIGLLALVACFFCRNTDDRLLLTIKTVMSSWYTAYKRLSDGRLWYLTSKHTLLPVTHPRKGPPLSAHSFQSIRSQHCIT